jgi:hypothetical protein
MGVRFCDARDLICHTRLLEAALLSPREKEPG